MGRPATLQRAGIEQHYDQVLPTAAGIHGTPWIRVTVCNAPAFITGKVLASFLSAYGRVEEINLFRSATGTVYGDYTFRLCLTREGFQAILEVIVSRERQMMAVVEGRCLRFCGCKQLGHIAKFCPQKINRMLQSTQSPQLPSALSSQLRLQKKDPG